MATFADLFTKRQLLAMTTLVRLVRETGERIRKESTEPDFGNAVQALLALLPGKQADLANSLCAWEPVAQCPRHLFGRQAISIVWDFAEGVPTGESSGAWEVIVRNSANTLLSSGSDWSIGTAQQADAANHPLLDDMVSLLFTDPPYYDAVPYSDLSDFFFVWLKSLLHNLPFGPDWSDFQHLRTT
jgi:putative DNA methylase